MADLEDLLEDELDVPEQGKAPFTEEDIFGDELDDEEDVPPPPPPEEAQPDDRKARLEALARNKRKEQEDAAAEAASRKRSRLDEATAAAEVEAGDAGAGADEALQPADGSAPGAGSAHDLFGSDEDEDDENAEHNIVATEADKQFIDDEGVPEEEQYGSDGEEQRLDQEEALEERALPKKGRKARQESDDELQMAVDDMIARMDAAAEEDRAQFAAGRPAFQKLKLLRQVEDFLVQVKYHEMFISTGGMDMLAKWLEPYPTGALPSEKMRGALLRLMLLMPIDTAHEGVKNLLAKSGLGKQVMFYYKCSAESHANRRMAKELVERWSRPIFIDSHAEAEKQRRKHDMLARAKAVRRQHEVASPTGPKPKIGDVDFRRHAAIPQAAKLDYVINPQSQDDRPQKVTPTKNSSRLQKSLNEVGRKAKFANSRAAKVSLEGRGVF